MFETTPEQRARLTRTWSLLARGFRATASAALALSSVAVLVLLVVALATSLYLPLHTDEIGKKLSMGRVFEEHGNVVALAPLCKSSWIQPVPLTLYPGAILATLGASGLGPMGIRVSGIALAVVALAGVVALAWRGIASRAHRLAAAAALCAISCLGTVPFLLVFSRGEHELRLCFLAYCALPILARRRPIGGLWLVLLGGAFLVVSSLFFYTHPKALFYLPFVLTAAALTAPLGQRLRFFAGVTPLVLLMAAQCYGLSADFVRCPDSPIMSKWFGEQSLNPRLLASDPAAFFRIGIGNVLETPERGWKEILFSANNTGWVPLPKLPKLSREVRDLNDSTKPVFLALFWVTPLALAFGDRRNRGARESVALGAALVFGLAGNAFFYNRIPFYNLTLVMPALSLVVALALTGGARPLPPLLETLGKVALALFLTLAARNLFTLVDLFGPALHARAAVAGPVVPDQPLAVPIFGYEAERTKIRALARSCGVEGDGARHLVIDDYTLLAFDRLREPISLLFVTDVTVLVGAALRGKDVLPFLRGLDSPGMVGRCWLFPKVLRPRARVSGDYCCVGSDAFVDPDSP
jgi:hypothetical protein